MSRLLFIVIGVGGTGSLLARDLPKLLYKTNAQICLIDGDVIEEKNIIRQGFQKQDVGENKAIVLANKINSLYGTNCIVIDEYATEHNLLALCRKKKNMTPVIIGCVDNNATRVMIENVFKQLDNVIYIDSANSEYDGNLFIVSKTDSIQKGMLRGESYRFDLDKHPNEISCQEQVAKGNVQFLVTNAQMAVTILQHCTALLSHQLKEGVQVVKRFETVFYD